MRIGLEVYSKRGQKKKTLGGEAGCGDCGFSGITDPAENLGYYGLKEGDYIRHRVVFDIQGADHGTTILLATPVFDDIAIFYSDGIQIITYVEQVL